MSINVFRTMSALKSTILVHVSYLYFMVNCDRHVYNAVYSELTACNPTLTQGLQHRYKQSRLCVTEQ